MMDPDINNVCPKAVIAATVPPLFIAASKPITRQLIPSTADKDRHRKVFIISLRYPGCFIAPRLQSKGRPTLK
jgi:hypothetical protein